MIQDHFPWLFKNNNFPWPFLDHTNSPTFSSFRWPVGTLFLSIFVYITFSSPPWIEPWLTINRLSLKYIFSHNRNDIYQGKIPLYLTNMQQMQSRKWCKCNFRSNNSTAEQSIQLKKAKAPLIFEICCHSTWWNGKSRKQAKSQLIIKCVAAKSSEQGIFNCWSVINLLLFNFQKKVKINSSITKCNKYRQSQCTDHLLVVVAAIADVLDVRILGTARHFT